MLRPCQLSLLLGAAACAGSAPGAVDPAGGPAVRIDGEWADWAAVGVRWRESAVDDLPHAPAAIRIRHDDSALYLHLTVADTINLQAMPGTLRLALDGDGRAETGAVVDGMEGVDRVVEHSYRAPNGRWQGIRVRTLPNGEWRDSYGAGFWYAPTSSDRRFEIRLARRPADGPPIGDRISVRLSALDTNGTVRRSTPVLAATLPPAPARVHRAAVAELAKSPGALRAVTWNVGDDGPLLEPEGFRRTLAALDPDLVLFDELSPAIDTAWLLALLPGRERWRVLLGTGGGRQRTAVASIYPIAFHPALTRVAYPDSLRHLLGLPMSRQMEADIRGAPSDDAPTMGAVIEAMGLEILAVPVDLICCGGFQGAEERARRMTALALRDAVARAVETDPVDAVVIGGDLNLVGSRRPLEVLRRGLDPIDRADLALAPAPRLDRASNATWFAPTPFPPGRLDFLLVSPSRLAIARSFAFHPGDLVPGAAAALGLDRPARTDHLPVVADLIRSPRPVR